MKRLNLTPFQKKAGLAAVLLLVVLFPNLVPAAIVPVTAVAVWMTTQPLLFGLVVGAVAARRRRTAPKQAAGVSA